MSIRHVRAVQAYSKIEDDLTRHIVEVLALDIGRNDSPAHTSYRKIAERVRASVNTVRGRIDDAIKCGELIAAKDGKYIFYSINPELLPYGKTTAETPAENIGKEQGNRIATADDIERLYQRLYQNDQELYQRLYQKIVSVVSVVQTDADTEVKKEEESRKGKAPISSAPELAKYFQTQTGLVPNPQTLNDDWIPVLEHWREHYAGDAPAMIERAVSFARGDNDQGKTYTLRSPRSLVNIMANMSANGSSNGKLSLSQNEDGSFYG